jgi:hypothetical protein
MLRPGATAVARDSNRFERARDARSPDRTQLLIDSEELESGDALDEKFCAMTAAEIERFRRDCRKGEVDAQPHQLEGAQRTFRQPRPF